MSATAAGLLDREQAPEGRETWPSQYGPITPWTTAANHPDPARRMTFFTGVGHPHHLNSSPVPLFVSATTLARYRSRGEDFPARSTQAPWAGDSGAYAALMLNSSLDQHPWWMDPDEYGAMWVRLQDDTGWPPQFVASQDLPCEADVRRVTRMTVAQHQQLSTASYLRLAEEFPMVNWLPVLQGWEPFEYLQHFELYQRCGVDLAGMRVGVGSVCRRGSQRGVAAVIRALAPLGMKLHGFGVSLDALRLIGHLLSSADSQAWSATARRDHVRLPECTHMSRPDPLTGATEPTDCRNCHRWAIRWREQALEAVRTSAAAEVDAAGGLFDAPLALTLPAAPGPRPTRAADGATAGEQFSLFA